MGKSDLSAADSMAVMPPTFEQESYKLTKNQSKRWDLSEKVWQQVGSRIAALNARTSEARDAWCKFLVGAVYAYYKFHNEDLYHLILKLYTNIQAAGNLEMWIELYTVARLYWRASPSSTLSGPHFRAHCSSYEHHLDNAPPTWLRRRLRPPRRAYNTEQPSLRRKSSTKSSGDGYFRQASLLPRRCRCSSAAMKRPPRSA